MFRHIIVGMVVSFGVQIALTLLAVICYDLAALTFGWQTISEAVLDLGRDHTAFAVLVAVELVAPVMLLLGHLLFGQVVRQHAVRRETERCAAVALRTCKYAAAGEAIAAAIRRPPTGYYRPTLEGPPNAGPPNAGPP